MRAALKAGVVVLPFLAVFLALRSCAAGEAEDWRGRVAHVEPSAVVGEDADDLIVIGPDPLTARRAADVVRGFRRGLVREYGDLLGVPRAHRMVVVVFTTPGRLQDFARARMLHEAASLYGYTDSDQGAIFVPAASVRTLRHETVHWVVATAHAAANDLSPWLSEGLAQLFESYDPEATPPSPPGLAPEDRFRAQGLPGGTVDVERLLGLREYGTFVGTDGARNYLEALVLTAFLFEERPREKLQRHLREELEGADPRQAFRAIYRHDDETFRSDLRAYVQR